MCCLQMSAAPARLSWPRSAAAACHILTVLGICRLSQTFKFRLTVKHTAPARYQLF